MLTHIATLDARVVNAFDKGPELRVDLHLLDELADHLLLLDVSISPEGHLLDTEFLAEIVDVLLRGHLVDPQRVLSSLPAVAVPWGLDAAVEVC